MYNVLSVLQNHYCLIFSVGKIGFASKFIYFSEYNVHAVILFGLSYSRIQAALQIQT